MLEAGVLPPPCLLQPLTLHCIGDWQLGPQVEEQKEEQDEEKDILKLQCMLSSIQTQVHARLVCLERSVEL